MFRKIVIPLDGSPLAESVIDHIQRFAPPPTAKLILVSVLETYRYGMASNDLSAVDIMQYVREGTETYLKQQHERLEQLGYETTMFLSEGDAAQGILDVADSEDADTIAMTTHGRSGIARWAMGSIAERVTHNAKRPLFLTRAETVALPRAEMQTVIVTLDGTELAEQALGPAREIAKMLDAELLLLRVTPHLEDAERKQLFGNDAAAQGAMGKWQQKAEAYQAHMVSQLEAEGVRVRSSIVAGEPEQAIAEATVAENAAILVMGTHGRIGFDRLLHGSVANAVVRNVTCPLLLVRADEADGADATS